MAHFLPRAPHTQRIEFGQLSSDTRSPLLTSRAVRVDCYFVEPERTIQLQFVVKAGPLSREPDDRDVTIAGHPGYVAGHRYRLSTSRDVDVRAFVQLTVQSGPVVPADTPLPAGTDAKA